MENGDFLDNGLQVSIDYLAFTATDCKNPYEVAEMLGFDVDRFTMLDRGGMGYKSAIKLREFPVSIYYDGNENMGVHVVISGSAMSEAMLVFKKSLLTSGPFGEYYEKDFDSTFLSSWLSKIQTFAKFSRIDLAIDDIGSKYFTLDSLEQIFRSGSFVSKFRKKRFISSYLNDDTGTKTGHTIYFGERSSACFLRIYDKMLEQKYSHSKDIDLPWVRWELELKEERADHAVRQLINMDNLGAVCVGVLSNSLRLIERDNANKSRCSINPVWQHFINGVSPLSLYVAPPAKTVLRTKKWVNRQVAPALAMLALADGGDIEFLMHLLDVGRTRLNRTHFDAIERYIADLKKAKT